MSVCTYGFESNIHKGNPVYQYPMVFITTDPKNKRGIYFQRRVKKKNMAAIPIITKPSLLAKGIKLRTSAANIYLPFNPKLINSIRNKAHIISVKAETALSKTTGHVKNKSGANQLLLS